jgi:hypothetical protein
LRRLRDIGAVVVVGMHAYKRVAVPEFEAAAMACSERIRAEKVAAAYEWKRLYDIERGKRHRALLRARFDGEADPWPVQHRWIHVKDAPRAPLPRVASVWDLARTDAKEASR